MIIATKLKNTKLSEIITAIAIIPPENICSLSPLTTAKPSDELRVK